MSGDPSGYNKPSPGLWNTNSYLSSGHPFLTGGTLNNANFATNNAQQRVGFGYVTRSITVRNNSTGSMRVHYASIAPATGNVSGGRHYFTLSGSNTALTMNVKCREIFLSLTDVSASVDFDLFAELTNIPAPDMFHLTGTGITT